MASVGAPAADVDAEEQEEEAPQKKDENGGDDGSKLRDRTTTLIAILIVIVTLYLLIAAFWRGSETLALDASTVENDSLYQAQLEQQNEARDQRKSILLVAVGILGTVTGYYFGRTPAEKRAERAERNAQRVATESGAVHREVGQARERAAEDRQNREHADQRLKEAKRGIKRISDRLSPVSQQARATLGGGGTPAPAAAELLEAKTELDALADSLPG